MLSNGSGNMTHGDSTAFIPSRPQSSAPQQARSKDVPSRTPGILRSGSRRIALWFHLVLLAEEGTTHYVALVLMLSLTVAHCKYSTGLLHRNLVWSLPPTLVFGGVSFPQDKQSLCVSLKCPDLLIELPLNGPTCWVASWGTQNAIKGLINNNCSIWNRRSHKTRQHEMFHFLKIIMIIFDILFRISTALTVVSEVHFSHCL